MWRWSVGIGICAALSLGSIPFAQAVDAPYSGAVYISSEVITPTSPSDFLSIEYSETVIKRTFDRRVNAWINANSHVFSATFGCAIPTVDVIVNAEIDRQEAEVQATRFARILGQLPLGARKAIRELWVHPGEEQSGGGNSSILVYTDSAETNGPFVEEIFIHEAAHTSLDWQWQGVVEHEQWQRAVSSDGRFISQFALDYPDREDVAESYGAFLLHEASQTNEAIRSEAQQIGYTIPNRLNYFRSLGPEFSLSREACSIYDTTSQDSSQTSTFAERWAAAVAERGKGTQVLGTSLYEGGTLQARLRTRLKKGTPIRVILGSGANQRTLTRIVGSNGRVDVRVPVIGVEDVRVVDDRDRLVVRWRIR